MIQFSYSLLDCYYNTCPEQARHLYILRDVKKTYSVTGGVNVHKAIEERIKAKVPLPAEVAVAEPFIASLEAKGPIQAEVSLGVDNWLRPTGFWSKGDGKEAWLRGKFDVVLQSANAAFVGDWKSGKVRESPDQLEIGALLLMEAHDQIDTVTGVNIWLKVPQLGVPYTFTRKEKGQRWVPWIAKMRHIESLDPAKPWEKRTSGLCGWCPVRQCPENREAARLLRENMR